MGRVILAVIGGYFLIGVLVVATDRLFALLLPGMSGSPAPPAAYFALSLVTDTIYTVVGAYFCVAVAVANGVNANATKARWGLIAFGELMGLASQAMLWNSVPHWYGLGLLVLFPIGVWVGAGWRIRRISAGMPAMTG